MSKLILLIAFFVFSNPLSAKDSSKALKLRGQNIDLKSFNSPTLQSLGGAGLQNIKYFVVQFYGHISEQDKKMLEGQGIELLQYLPEDAFIVRGQYSKAESLKATSDRIYGISPYEPEWKLSEDFDNLSVLDETPVLMNIQVLPKVDISEVESSLSKISGVSIVLVGNRTITASANKLKSFEISNIGGIEFIQVQPDIKSSYFDVGESETLPKEPINEGSMIAVQSSVAQSLGSEILVFSSYESGTKILNFNKAWERNLTGKGQIVAMADTGLDTGDLGSMHRDLRTVLGGESYSWVSWVTNNWSDPNAHGTHVAGSIIGQGYESKGQMRGGAYEAQLYVQSLASSFLGMYDTFGVPRDITDLFRSAHEHNARLHTNSWGDTTNFGAYTIESVAVDEFMWHHPDFVILFAAGNSGGDADQNGVIDEGSVSAPGTSKNAITIGASENKILSGGYQMTCGSLGVGKAGPVKNDKMSDNPNGLACFSSRGPTRDGRIKPDVVAPGTNIVSTRSHGWGAGKLWGAYDDNYLWSGGTSMSTPIVAGAAAVVRGYLGEIVGKNPSAALVKAALMHTATDIFPGQFGLGEFQEIPKVRPNNQEGFGRVNMDFATDLSESVIVDNTIGVFLNGEEIVNLNLSREKASQKGKVIITLVYTDAPGSASSGKALVNNLDLKVKTPNGKEILSQDTINNFEHIEITDVLPGNYIISVVGENVPNGRNGSQPYALIASFVKNVNN